jgi:hypothetical protein
MSISAARLVLRTGATGAVLLTLAATQPARAQFFGWSWGGPPAPQPVSPQQPGAVAQRLAARGWRVLSLRRNGGVYLADVSDRSGHRRRLIVDAFSGSILQVFAYGSPRPPAGIGAGLVPIPDGGPAYASREPGGFAPEQIEPQGPAPRLAGHPKTSETRPKHTLARREETAPGNKAVPNEAPSAATGEPTEAPSASPAPSGSAGSKAHEQALAKGADPHPPAGVAAPTKRPAAQPAPAVNGPGYANGVPINPLD